MAIRPLTNARRDLEPYRDGIVECVMKAHNEYLMVPGLHRFSLGCKAGMLSDLIKDTMRTWSATVHGVNFIPTGNLQTFTFGNNWIVRVKKMDDLFRVGVSPTESSNLYNRNEVPDSISTLLQEEEATLLYLGWQVMDNAPDRPQICLICNNANAEVHWAWALAGSEPPPQLALPVPDLPTAPTPGIRVRIKAGAPKKRSE